LKYTARPIGTTATSAMSARAGDSRRNPSLRSLRRRADTSPLGARSAPVVGSCCCLVNMMNGTLLRVLRSVLSPQRGSEQVVVCQGSFLSCFVSTAAVESHPLQRLRPELAELDVVFSVFECAAVVAEPVSQHLCGGALGSAEPVIVIDGRTRGHLAGLLHATQLSLGSAEVCDEF